MGYQEELKNGLETVKNSPPIEGVKEFAGGVKKVAQKAAEKTKEYAKDAKMMAEFATEGVAAGAKKVGKEAKEAWDVTKKVGKEILARTSPLSGGTSAPPKDK